MTRRALLVVDLQNEYFPGGKLLLEHGWQQGEAVRRILEERGYQAVRTLPDLAGLDRVTMACNGERSAGHS